MGCEALAQAKITRLNGYIKKGLLALDDAPITLPKAPCLILLVLRWFFDLDHLAAPVGAAVLADMMRAHQLAALLARDQRRQIEPLVLAAVATAVARNFCFWCGTHDVIFYPFPYR